MSSCFPPNTHAFYRYVYMKTVKISGSDYFIFFILPSLYLLPLTKIIDKDWPHSMHCLFFLTVLFPVKIWEWNSQMPTSALALCPESSVSWQRPLLGVCLFLNVKLPFSDPKHL